tara:strand:+ start:69 stop:209 length:141 start_codon:yes stop_codon:yes gene_type:complete
LEKSPRPSAVYQEVKSLVEFLDLEKDSVALHYYDWDYLGREISDSN